MSVMWNMEEIKLEIEAEGMLPYTITSDTSITGENRRFIEKVSTTATENNSSNPFGLCGSRSFNFSIVDLDDYLSATNTESPYYKKIRNGSKVIIYLKDIVKNEWKNYGTCYVNNISGSFNNGVYQAVSLSCKDKLENIGSKNNPKIPCYRNITVESFLDIILSSVGLVKDIDWKINPALGSKKLIYGITVGTKIRDTLNGLAQFLQARITIDRDNVIRIEKAVSAYGKQYTLSYDLVNSLSNIYVNNANYKDVVINYNVDGYKVEDILFNDNSYQLKSGMNELNNLVFKNKAISVRHATITFDTHLYESTVGNPIYYAYQDGIISMKVEVQGDDIAECNIYIEGMSIEKSTREKTATIMNEENSNGTDITLDIKYIINESDASELIESVKDIVDKMSRQITIKTIATPFIDIGDEIILEDDDFTPTYKGTYKVIKYQTTHGSNYSNILTLIEV